MDPWCGSLAYVQRQAQSLIKQVYFISLQWHFNAANVIRRSLHSDGGGGGGGKSAQLYMELRPCRPAPYRVSSHSTLGLGEQVLAFSSMLIPPKTAETE